MPRSLLREVRPIWLPSTTGLNELAKFDERQAKIVELHFFGGLGYEEIAAFLKIGRSTVTRDIRMAQIWLRNYVSK